MIKCLDLPCIECDRPMRGINSHEVRDTCEQCGGNTTEFHEGNPWRPKLDERPLRQIQRR